MSSKRRDIVTAIAFCAGMIVFALCAHRPALIVPRIVGIALAVAALSLTVAKARDPLSLLGWQPLPRRRWWVVPVAIGVGVALAVIYRTSRSTEPLPTRLAAFCLVSAAIGVCEELGYRGFVQGCLGRWGWPVACTGAAVAHTLYKCCLFAFPATPAPINFVTLAGATFAVGLLLGVMREKLGGILAPALAHAAFDIVAYGHLSEAPWWV